jgi:hypothetical protein
MKVRLLILSACIVAVSCNSKPKATEAVIVPPVDTVVKVEAPVVAPVAVKHTTTRTSSGSSNNNYVNGSGTASSESQNAAKPQSRLSQTAKGAIIGGVVGAGTGAVVNKKNRLAGGVVGGVVGAGAGAVIGNELDKKSGRH